MLHASPDGETANQDENVLSGMTKYLVASLIPFGSPSAIPSMKNLEDPPVSAIVSCPQTLISRLM